MLSRKNLAFVYKIDQLLDKILQGFKNFTGLDHGSVVLRFISHACLKIEFTTALFQFFGNLPWFVRDVRQIRYFPS